MNGVSSISSLFSFSSWTLSFRLGLLEMFSVVLLRSAHPSPAHLLPSRSSERSPTTILKEWRKSLRGISWALNNDGGEINGRRKDISHRPAPFNEWNILHRIRRAVFWPPSTARDESVCCPIFINGFFYKVTVWRGEDEGNWKHIGEDVKKGDGLRW